MLAGVVAAGVGLLPAPAWTTPAFEPGVLIGLALPLFIVTMASQNVTGMTVPATDGYRPSLPPVLAGTGAATVAAAAAEEHRDAAVVTLVVSASGVAPLGVSAPFWGLVAGLVLMAVQHGRAG